MTEVEYLESRIREDRLECNRLREKERNEHLAQNLRNIYESLVDYGFTEEQAFELFMVMVKKAWSNS